MKGPLFVLSRCMLVKLWFSRNSFKIVNFMLFDIGFETRLVVTVHWTVDAAGKPPKQITIVISTGNVSMIKWSSEVWFASLFHISIADSHRFRSANKLKIMPVYLYLPCEPASPLIASISRFALSIERINFLSLFSNLIQASYSTFCVL